MAVIAIRSDLGAQRQYSSMLIIVLFVWQDYFILSLCSFHIAWPCIKIMIRKIIFYFCLILSVFYKHSV